MPRPSGATYSYSPHRQMLCVMPRLAATGTHVCAQHTAHVAAASGRSLHVHGSVSGGKVGGGSQIAGELGII